MSWIIIKQPHPLDEVWRYACQQREAAQDAVDALPDGTSQEQEDAASAALYAAEMAIIGLPARNFSDCVVKLTVSGLETGDVLTGCDPTTIVNEMTSVMDAAIHRGEKLRRDVPGLLEGVSL